MLKFFEVFAVLVEHLEKLRYFVAVGRVGSVSAAARQLHMSQSAVSHSLASLEDVIGVPLLTRLARGVALTQAGQELYDYSRRMLLQVGSLEERLRHPDAEAVGLLRIGAHETLAIHVLPPLLRRFYVAHPHLQISLTAGRVDELVRGLRRDDLDVIVSVEPLPDRSQYSIPLTRGKLGFFSPTEPVDQYRSLAKSTISIEEANEVPLLMDVGAHVRQGVPLQNALAHLGLGAHHLFELGSSEAAMRLAAEGCGIAVVADRNAQELVGQGRLRPVRIRGIKTSEFGHYTICATTKKGLEDGPVVSEFLEALTNLF